MKKIAIIGECMIELNGQPFGSMLQSYGGDTLNTAVYLARMTKRTELDISYISVLGTDNISEKMISFWQQEGINTQLVLRDPKRMPGLYLIQLDEYGERTFLNWRNQAAARYLLQHPDYAKVTTQLASYDMIYISGISLAILPVADRRRFIQQLQLLAKQNVKIAFDSNYRPALWESQLEAQLCYAEVLPYVHLALVTQDDEEALWQDSSLEAMQQRLQSYQIPHLVIKAGKQGAYYFPLHGAMQHVPTQEVKNVVDTTSAGDSFNAGFLAGYLTGKSIEQCCQQGNLLAGVVIQHKGAIIPPPATEELFHQFNKDLT